MALHVIERPPLEAGPANGAAVVLVHGSLDRASSFRRVAARLRDATVIAYDRRGYAGSVEVSPTSAFERQVDDFFEVVRGRTVIGVGHSLGGDVVLSGTKSLAATLPRRELHWIDGSTHGAHLSNPGAFAHLIRRALTLQPGSTS